MTSPSQLPRLLPRPVAYSVHLARIIGDVKATLMLSQLLYWSRVGVNVLEQNGWIHKRRDEWELETGLSRYMQQSARQRLIDLQLMQECSIGMPAKLYYRVNFKVLGQRLQALRNEESKGEQLSLLTWRKDEIQGSSMIGPTFALYRDLVDIGGTLANAVFLSRVMQLDSYMERVQKSRTNPESSLVASADSVHWMSMNFDQWQTDTGLTPAQSRKAREQLTQKGLLMQALQTIPRKRHFSALNKKVLFALFHQLQKSKRLAKTTEAATVVAPKANISTSNAVKSPSVCSFPPTVNKGANPFLRLKSSVLAVSEGELFQNETPYTPYTVFHFETVAATELKKPNKLGANSRPPWLVLANLRGRVNSVNDYKGMTTTTIGQTQDQDKNQSVGLGDVVVVNEQTSNQEKQEGLIWPKELTQEVKNSLQHWLNKLGKVGGLSEPESMKQTLLDELDGNLQQGRIRNPVGWMRRMVDLALQGAFLPELAHEVAKARIERAAHVRRMAHVGKSGEAGGSEVHGAAKNQAELHCDPVVARQGLARLQALRREMGVKSVGR